MKSRAVRILLADTDDIVRAGLRTVFEARENWEVCSETGSGKEAVRLAKKYRPDVVVLDLDLGKVNGIAATRQIKQDRQETEVFIFTTNAEEAAIRDVLAAGAGAFVLKSEGSANLIKAIDSLSERSPFFTSRAAETLLKNFLSSSRQEKQATPLTRRQREIVRLLASGSSNKEVATALSISIKTVQTHRAAIMRKLGFRSIANLVRYAVRERVIKA
jgi:DNA-binding NarL/FixJ family response regulator